ncbi:hypothetical protein F5Y12DRAFT_733325 [Xylaria sp. FL1777]|nr:hypothetical protein F5Y12DRAFT_733325 [Xylaria sp. FL1777]
MNPAIRKRVWKEINDVNADFFNLRTVIAPAADDDTFSQFFFVMSPNDGAMAHLTVAGCFYIHNTYPESPPVVHVYTWTGRYNVDVYSAYRRKAGLSTVCFDILRSPAVGGTWNREYTISLLFASLMSALVSFYVPQIDGSVRAEYVSMGKLRGIKEAARATHHKYKHLVPELLRIPLVEATAVPAKQMAFPSTITVVGDSQTTSDPIYLQDPDQCTHTFAMDLSDLHADIVFSVILTNSKTDLVGQEKSTILVRNGVTATAARKRANEKTNWFYHGKPMNDGDMRLHVTIGHDQMTFAYYSDGRRYVHGDCPVSRLTASQIGDVRGVPFYVHIYMKKKNGNPATVTFLDTEDKGYIHSMRDQVDVKDEGSDDNFGFEFVTASEVAEAIEQCEEHESILGQLGKLSLSDKEVGVAGTSVDNEASTDKIKSNNT